VRVTPSELTISIGVPVDEFLRLSVVPNLPAPWSQILELILTDAPGSMMHVPGGIITVALPKPGYAAEVRAACNAAESSVEPSHRIPVAKTGFMMQVLLIAHASAASETLGGIRLGTCPSALPSELRITNNIDSTKLLN
jgi:hypothetical protein